VEEHALTSRVAARVLLRVSTRHSACGIIGIDQTLIVHGRFLHANLFRKGAAVPIESLNGSRDEQARPQRSADRSSHPPQQRRPSRGPAPDPAASDCTKRRGARPRLTTDADDTGSGVEHRPLSVAQNSIPSATVMLITGHEDGNASGRQRMVPVAARHATHNTERHDRRDQNRGQAHIITGDRETRARQATGTHVWGRRQTRRRAR
jgi:hypothetical protein